MTEKKEKKEKWLIKWETKEENFTQHHDYAFNSEEEAKKFLIKEFKLYSEIVPKKAKKGLRGIFYRIFKKK